MNEVQNSEKLVEPISVDIAVPIQPVVQPEVTTTPDAQVVVQSTQPIVESVKEEVATNIEIKTPIETPKDDLVDISDEEIKKLTAKFEEEQMAKLGLGIIKTAREKLEEYYKENKELLSKNDLLNTENLDLKKSVEQLSLKVKDFETKDALQHNEIRKEQLSRLSEKYKEIGTERSAEQLSVYNDEQLLEFEKILNAVTKKSSSEQLNKVTIPSESVPNKIAPLQVTKKITGKETLSNVDKTKFFERVCKDMSKQADNKNK